ncbi:hypothetical protein [Leifsonia sp. NPDC058230]|uniref:hypothetical protein n=1 Tax=Leifsonia sp. NPDC058230 TaxID=3346391 RepID=UPI0036DE6C71
MTGIAVGYVLGARAGRKRYEQIKSAAMKVWESPGIQQQVNAVEDFVAAKVGDVPGMLYEGAKKLVVQASDRQKSQTSSRAATSPAAPSAPPAPSAPAAKAAAAAKAPAAKAAAAKAAPAKPAGAKAAGSKAAGSKPAATKPAASKDSGETGA